MNNSVYEQIFRTQSVSDDVLCLELRKLLSFDNEDSAVIDDIVSLGKNMGLEVNNEVGLKQSRVVPRDRNKKKNPLPNNNISLPHHLPLTPSTLLHTTFHLRRQLSSSPPSTYAVNSPPYRYGNTKLSFRLYLICLVLYLSFFVIELMVSIDFALRTCAQSTVVKV